MTDLSGADFVLTDFLIQSNYDALGICVAHIVSHVQHQ